MPAAYRVGDSSVGHDGYPATACTSSPASKTYWEGKLAATVGALHATHTKPDNPPHPSSARNISGGASKTNIEGSAAARTGDPIGCGDTCGAGASKTVIE